MTKNNKILIGVTSALLLVLAIVIYKKKDQILSKREQVELQKV